MREYVTIVKQIMAREEKLEFRGKKYRIPYDGPDAKGYGKPLKSMLHGRRDIPVYAGSMAPKGQQLAAELCDGVLLTCMNPERPEAIMDNLKAGFETAPKRFHHIGGLHHLAPFDIGLVVVQVRADRLVNRPGSRVHSGPCIDDDLARHFSCL